MSLITKRAKVALKLSKLSIEQKVALSRSIVERMTGNPGFTDPNPSLASVAAATDALEAAYIAAADGSKSKIAVRNEQEKAFNALLTRLAAYVDNVSDGQESVILSSGIDVRKQPAPLGLLPVPTGIYTRYNGKSGVVELKWNRVYGAASYRLEIKSGGFDASVWAPHAVGTRTMFSFEGLTSGMQYWFRVCAVGAAGESGFSDPATCFAP